MVLPLTQKNVVDSSSPTLLAAPTITLPSSLTQPQCPSTGIVVELQTQSYGSVYEQFGGAAIGQSMNKSLTSCESLPGLRAAMAMVATTFEPEIQVGSKEWPEG